MPKRSQITEAQVGLSAPIAFTFGEAECHLRYRWGAVSPALIDRVDAAIQGKAAPDSYRDTLVEFIARVVRWWDVTEEDGTPTALTRSVLADMETDFLQECFYAVLGDLLPGEASAAPSSSTSS